MWTIGKGLDMGLGCGFGMGGKEREDGGDNVVEGCKRLVWVVFERLAVGLDEGLGVVGLDEGLGVVVLMSSTVWANLMESSTVGGDMVSGFGTSVAMRTKVGWQ
nr:hypothetical protein Iba_chr10bCG9540 [Ipomoea batatas]